MAGKVKVETKRPDAATMLMKRYNVLSEAARLALKTLEGLEQDGTIRLPNQTYEAAVAALKKAL